MGTHKYLFSAFDIKEIRLCIVEEEQTQDVVSRDESGWVEIGVFVLLGVEDLIVEEVKHKNLLFSPNKHVTARRIALVQNLSHVVDNLRSSEADRLFKLTIPVCYLTSILSYKFQQFILRLLLIYYLRYILGFIRTAL